MATLVLDNNVLFSILNPHSTASYLFSSIRAEFFAPEFIKSEMNEHLSECLAKSTLSEHELSIRQTEVEGSITFAKESVYDTFLTKAIECLSDPKDAPYLALALSKNASIW